MLKSQSITNNIMIVNPDICLFPGDLVLRVKAFSFDHKIADKLQQTPHQVLSQMGRQPVFKVQEVGAKDQEGILVLYRNMMFPLQMIWSMLDDRNADSIAFGDPRAMVLIKPTCWWTIILRAVNTEG